MGYNLRAGLVEENQKILLPILFAVQNERKIRFSVPREHISSEQYKLRRILKACDVYIEECDGRFANLGQKVRVNALFEADALVIEPKNFSYLTPVKNDHRQALKKLDTLTGAFAFLDFYPEPDFDLDHFAAEVKARGWDLDPVPVRSEEDGLKVFALSRLETKSGTTEERPNLFSNILSSHDPDSDSDPGAKPETS